MSWPELAQLTGNKIGLFFKNPMPAFLDDATLCTVGYRPGAIEAVIAEGSSTTPGQHGHGKLIARQFFGLFGHLWNVAVKIQTRSQVPRLPHLHDIELNVFLRSHPGCMQSP